MDQINQSFQGFWLPEVQLGVFPPS